MTPLWVKVSRSSLVYSDSSVVKIYIVLPSSSISGTHTCIDRPIFDLNRLLSSIFKLEIL